MWDILTDRILPKKKSVLYSLDILNLGSMKALTQFGQYNQIPLPSYQKRESDIRDWVWFVPEIVIFDLAQYYPIFLLDNKIITV